MPTGLIPSSFWPAHPQYYPRLILAGTTLRGDCLYRPAELHEYPEEVQNAVRRFQGKAHYRMQADGHNMLCNGDGSRSIFDDVDE